MTNYGYVLDVSAFQPQAAYYNFWPKWKARGVKGGIVKLSEGTGWTNGYGAGQIAAIKHEGLMASGYHFSRFRGNTYQAVSEANLAIACARQMGLPQGAPLVLDYEERLGYRASNTQAAIAFLKCIKAAGYVPVFYSYSGMASLWDFEAIHTATGAVMWIAAYPTLAAVTAPYMSYFPGISNFIGAWQFTDNFFGEHIDGSIDLTGVFTGMAEQKVTSGGHLDGVAFTGVNGNQIKIDGWFGSDKAQGKGNAFVILTNENGECGRAKVNLTERPDVAKAYPDIPNGGHTGFSATLPYGDQLAGHKCNIIFRYSSDPDGNKDYVDYTASYTFDKSEAHLDSINTVVYSNKLRLSGWFASDLSIGHDNRFMILLDPKTKQEYQRINVSVTQREDVENSCPEIYGTLNSGFSADFNYSPDLVGKPLQLVMRYSDATNGEGHCVDYWCAPFDGPAMPVVDGKSETTVMVHDFSANQVKDGLIELKFK